MLPRNRRLRRRCGLRPNWMTIAFHCLLIDADNTVGEGLEGGELGIAAPPKTKNLDQGGSTAPEETMAVMAFEVCCRGRDARWIVRVGNAVYGAYLDREQALLDAVDAARDALQDGREAEVWVRDSSSAARIL